jgi:hypothetical protein
VLKGDDGLWHLIVAEMQGHCGLQTWQRNSFIRHATSHTIDGTYTPAEQVMGIFSHNPTCFDATAAGGPQCILLHIGAGNHSESRHPIQTNCTKGYTPAPAFGETNNATVDDHRSTAKQGATIRPQVTGVNATATYDVLIMDSFASGRRHDKEGNPTWEKAWRAGQLSCAADKAGKALCPFDNPTGWVDKDGTAWINYVQRGDHTTGHDHGGRGGYGFGLAKAPSWKGPYLPLSGYWDAPILASNGSAWRNCEDSVLYRDARGNLHMLFHYFGLNTDHGDHGGHAHAGPDGLRWSFSNGHPFDETVAFTNTSSGRTIPSAVYSNRQRPHVLLSPTGELTHLLTGVRFDTKRPYPTGCSHGGNAPCDHSWTSLQPVRTSKANDI